VIKSGFTSNDHCLFRKRKVTKTAKARLTKKSSNQWFAHQQHLKQHPLLSAVNETRDIALARAHQIPGTLAVTCPAKYTT